MKTTEVRIIIPEGMEIDKENSAFECIKFKPKSLDYYVDIQPRYMSNRRWYTTEVRCSPAFDDKLVVYRMLLETADYLNKSWKPDCDNLETAYYIVCDNCISNIKVVPHNRFLYGLPGFRTKKLAEQAIDIIGKKNLELFFK